MDTPKIILGRIDNRLIHGQVGTVWVRHLGANLVIVADDEVATNNMEQSLMKMCLSAGGSGNVKIRFFSIKHTIDIIWKASPSQSIFVVTRTPKEMRALIDGGVPIPAVNVGNMHSADGKRALSSAVFVDDQDIDDLDHIEKKGIRVFLQTVPSAEGSEYHQTK